jgi:hypothetical protein
MKWRCREVCTVRREGNVRLQKSRRTSAATDGSRTDSQQNVDEAAVRRDSGGDSDKQPWRVAGWLAGRRGGRGDGAEDAVERVRNHRRERKKDGTSGWGKEESGMVRRRKKARLGYLPPRWFGRRATSAANSWLVMLVGSENGRSYQTHRGLATPPTGRR